MIPEINAKYPREQLLDQLAFTFGKKVTLRIKICA